MSERRVSEDKIIQGLFHPGFPTAKKEAATQLKAFVIMDSKHRFRGLDGVFRTAISSARAKFKTTRRVFVKKIWHVPELHCYVALVEGPDSGDKISGGGEGTEVDHERRKSRGTVRKD